MTHCTLPLCPGQIHTVTRTDPDGNAERTSYCATCGTPIG